MRSSIFFEFNLPNSATWFYLSLFLAVALFFQFTRVLSLRNWDLLALFLFVPGFLFIQEAKQSPAPPALPPVPHDKPADVSPAPSLWPERERLLGYVWLLSASGYWLARCLFDLATAKRPAASPNLTTPGMIWFGLSLLVCLTAVNYTRPNDPWGPVGRRPGAITGVEQGAAAVVQQTQPEDTSAAQVLFWVERSLATVCHIAVVVGLFMVGAKHFQSATLGAAAATLYLLIPYTAYHIGQVHHVWPAALILWAAFAYRYPAVAGLLLGLAAGTTFFPVLLAPAWVQFYRHRGAGRFVVTFAATGAATLAVTLIAAEYIAPGPDVVWPPFQFADWQPWREPVAESVWTGAHWAYRLPVFLAFAAFVLGTAFWPPVRDLGDLFAVTAAVMIGIQFWYADRGGLYVLWYAPLLVLMVLRPTATDLQPADLGSRPWWVARVMWWTFGKFGLLPPQTAPVPATA